MRPLMDENVLQKMICPNCGSAHLLEKTFSLVDGQHQGKESVSLECGVCKNIYLSHDGIVDFAGSIPDSRSVSQWAMEFKPLVSLYENIWRPMVTKPFSDLKWEMDTVQKWLQMKGNLDVLDLGCGPGNFSRLIARSVNPGVVIGFDLSLPMLKKGLRNSVRMESSSLVLIRGDVARWPFAKASFDRIHCSGALHLFPALPQVFASVYDTLKPGGLFVAATYCRAAGFLKIKIQNHISSAYGFHWFEREELRHLAEGAGFTGWQHVMKKQGIIFSVKKRETAF